MNRLTCLLIVLAACGDDANPAQPDAPSQPDPDAPPGPSLTFYDYVQAIDITPDGRTAVFGDISTPEGHLWFLDTITGAVENRTDVGDPLHDFATGIAQTGAVSAVHGVPEQAGVWTPGVGWSDIASPHAAGCDQEIGAAWDLSADASVVVGFGWNQCNVEAFRMSGGTLTPLAKLGTNTRPTVVSDDGAVAAGWASTDIVDRAPARWLADGTGVYLERVTDDTPGEVLAIDANGDTFAGIEGFDAVVWGATKTIVPRLDTLLPSDKVFANALSADGKTVFGGQGDAFSSIPVAYRWSEAGGLEKIEDLAKAAGLTIPADLTLNSVMAVSADGRVMIGTAMNPNTQATKVFALRL